MKITLEELRTQHPDWIIMEAVVGSQSFGLATETSDIDCRGVFVLPLEYRLAYDAIDQIADDHNNEVYWEVAKFIQLFTNGNPSSLEFLFSPDSCIRIGKEYFEFFRNQPVNYLNMRCRDTFVKYARGQLQRAYGLNKKVFDPQPKEAPKVLDYCYVIDGYGARPVKEWLSQQVGYGHDQKWFALSAIDHITDGYALFYQVKQYHCNPKVPEHEWRWAYGIVANEETASDIQLGSIPKGEKPVATMFFNKNAFSHACKKHSEYWQWVALRNEERYANTINQGKGYDAKNVMHCIRLLMTAKDIATKHVLTVDRTADRDYLLSIKAGKYSYDEVVKLGNDLCNEVETLFEQSGLPTEAFDGVLTPHKLLLQVLNKCGGVFNRLNV